MYKLLLVDDEEDVREGLLREMDWESCGYEVIGTADNGREAIDMMERLRPDVVVTDIQMPFMNGLQLAEWIRQSEPTTKIVILTGYDEFEYAQKAIRLHIDEYVLKPFSAQELSEVLNKVCDKMNDEMEARNNLQVLKEHMRRTTPILREVFLRSLLTERMISHEIEQKLDTYNLTLTGSNYMVGVISIEISFSHHPTREPQSPSPLTHQSVHQSLSQTVEGAQSAPQPLMRTTGNVQSTNRRPLLQAVEHAELAHQLSSRTDEQPHESHSSRDLSIMRYAVCNIADEIMSRAELGMALIHNDEVVVLAIEQEHHSHTKESFSQQVMKCCEEIRQAGMRYAKVQVTIGIGSVVEQLSELSYSYQDARYALDYRMVLGTERLIWIDDVEVRNPSVLRFDELQERALLRCLKVGTEEELTETMDQLFGSLAECHVSISVSDVQLYLMEMLLTMMKVARDAGVELEAAAQQWNRRVFGGPARSATSLSLFDEVRRMRHAQEARQWMTELCAHLMQHIVKDRQTSYQKLVEDAVTYVREHYADSEMSIAKVCGHLHISMGYFSGIFKKETKMTFNNYLLQLRMERAKELLRTSDWKTFEIAEHIGYPDANYFSYSFKKHVGLSPKEYRKGLE